MSNPIHKETLKYLKMSSAEIFPSMQSVNLFINIVIKVNLLLAILVRSALMSMYSICFWGKIRKYSVLLVD